MSKLKVISTKDAPTAVGPYSQAIIANGFVFVSGQLGIDPKTGSFAGEDTKSQFDQALKNLRSVLSSVNLTLDNVVKTTVFLTDINEFALINEVYANYFKNILPARSAIEVSKLPKGGRVEIEAIASFES
ncbi:endoribonuclease L-PSP [Thermodesulfobium narugense DSM 14796]|uniref:Endoribonuclease L-PSP n=1 Tax=Thermodesulfobium narugense DSM 14796 TaxID=747365 RepID=M1E584_9BACT|nr:RidA family protein [Thermodesulfobium narugense]AEE14887.1 endoribonuclease L-PSP [Thermodesulfobium narugense DSM 14796]